MQVSHEHYLKAIYVLYNEFGFVKQADIAKAMNHSRPSVCRAVYSLKEEKLINVNEHNNITLTLKGEQTAKKVMERYSFFKNFLVTAGIDEKDAVIDACNLEHAISPESFEQLKAFVLSNS